ncbi:MAG: DUF5615 family PIN-like protein [Armatimonadota bacterium]
MRILADENFPGSAVAALMSRGHDVVWIQTDSPGIADKDVLSRAVLEERILITFDKDFGELAFHAGLSASSGVILFRISISEPSALILKAVQALESRSDWAGHFSVVEDDRIRMTQLPDQR